MVLRGLLPAFYLDLPIGMGQNIQRHAFPALHRCGLSGIWLLVSLQVMQRQSLITPIILLVEHFDFTAQSATRASRYRCFPQVGQVKNTALPQTRTVQA
jgi:hypothetical protein